jgi:transposase
LLDAKDGQNMIEKQGSKFLLDKIQSLTKALEQAQLKNVMLETMIEVAESELSIKIRKKRGTKQS